MIETKAWEKLHTDIWEKGKVIENNGKKLYWDWEHRMGTSCTARRPDLTLEDRIEKKIMIIDMACPNESNKEKKREEKMRKYQQLCYEIRERRDGYCLKTRKTCNGYVEKCKKTVLWESETIMRKILSGLLI